MNDGIRRKLERIAAVLGFIRANPDPSAGFATAQAGLETGMARAEELARQQRAGLNAERAATSRRKEIKGVVLPPILDHVHQAAVAASKEVPELARKFRLPQSDGSYRAFRTAVGAMGDDAQSHKELLVRHGLAEPLLAGLTQGIQELDAATQQAGEGRRAHVGAGAELEAVVQELQQVVNVMDGLNRFRFANDAEKLAAWESASTLIVRGRGKSAESKPVGGTTPAVTEHSTPAL